MAWSFVGVYVVWWINKNVPCITEPCGLCSADQHWRNISGNRHWSEPWVHGPTVLLPFSRPWLYSQAGLSSECSHRSEDYIYLGFQLTNKSLLRGFPLKSLFGNTLVPEVARVIHLKGNWNLVIDEDKFNTCGIFLN